MSQPAIKVYGASDDLIEVAALDSAHASEEFTANLTTTKLSFDDGTVLRIRYGKPSDGAVWWIEVMHAGSAFISRDECLKDDGTHYSDVVYLGPTVLWVMKTGRRYWLGGDEYEDPPTPLPQPPHIDIVALNDDWEAAYIEGVKVAENHSVRVNDILTALTDRGIVSVAYRDIEDELVGDLPDTISEVEQQYGTK